MARYREYEIERARERETKNKRECVTQREENRSVKGGLCYLQRQGGQDDAGLLPPGQLTDPLYKKQKNNQNKSNKAQVVSHKSHKSVSHIHVSHVKSQGIQSTPLA